MIDILRTAALGLCTYYLALGYARVLCHFADSLCTCRKGAWNPTCPRHGR